MLLTNSFVLLAASFASLSNATPLSKRDVSVAFDGRTFVNKGLVGFGRVGASDVDSYGETLGGIGSSIYLESFKTLPDGSHVGTIRLNPDRGHNTVTTTDYRSRTNVFDFTFNPAKTGAGVQNIQLTYKNSVLYRNNPGFNYTTGLDPLNVRPATPFSPQLPLVGSDNHIPFDQEGWAKSNVGTLAFTSDEYGPYIYTFDSITGVVLAATAPPPAIVPVLNGKVNFTSQTQPDTGRADNQGFEGLTFDRNTNMLWALLQSSTNQDSDKNNVKNTNRYTRLLGYDASNPLILKLKSEYVVPLPQSKSLKTYAQSELHVVDATTFLVLARDGNGLGDAGPGDYAAGAQVSSYKQADLISTKGATNIAGTKYDQPQNPIDTIVGTGKTSKAVLNTDIVPTAYQQFVSLIDPTQLAKFGLRNTIPIDNNLIASKLESLAVTPLLDAQQKPTGDHLLFVVSDNDFITRNGHQASQQANGQYVVQPYTDAYAVTNNVDQDTQVFIYQVTLPGYSQGNTPN